MASIARNGYLVFAAVLLIANGLWLFGQRLRLAERNAGTERPEAPYDVMADLVLPFGYSLEEHFAVTEDGYILRLFRLGARQRANTSDSAANRDSAAHNMASSTLLDSPADPAASDSSLTSPRPGAATTADLTAATNPNTSYSRPAPVAFLHHPLMGSSVDFVAMRPGRSLGFMMADAGYDVWLTNVRGNRFSRNHTRLDPDAPSDVEAFWSFSWDEHAALDLPAALNLVAAVTGQQEGFLLVGYSQGTTVALAALASQPRVSRRVAAAALLAPVAFVSHMTSPLFRLMVRGRVERVFKLLGLHEYGGHSPAASELAARFCGAHPRPCAAYLELLCGTNPQPGGNLDPEMVPTIMRFLPSGTSVQNMAHWGQVVRSSDPLRLPYFDYGTDCSRPVPAPDGVRVGGQYACNQAAYNSTTPPVYPLSSITTPLALFSGGHDALADPVDVALLLSVLQRGAGGEGGEGVKGGGGGGFGGGSDTGGGGGGAVQLIHDEPDYGHLDFGVGHDAADRIYPLVLAFLKQYTPRPARPQL